VELCGLVEPFAIEAVEKGSGGRTIKASVVKAESYLGHGSVNVVQRLSPSAAMDKANHNELHVRESQAETDAFRKPADAATRS
jgi:hypothetical protein